MKEDIIALIVLAINSRGNRLKSMDLMSSTDKYCSDLYGMNSDLALTSDSEVPNIVAEAVYEEILSIINKEGKLK